LPHLSELAKCLRARGPVPMNIKRIAAVLISLAYDAMRRTVAPLGCVLGAECRCGHVVLYYHGVTDAQRSRFHRQMQLLRSRAQVVPLGHTASGSAPRWHVCITFDDGLDNIRRNAIPVLVQLGVPATFFVVAGRLGQTAQWPMEPECAEADEPLMTSGQLRSLPRDLFVVGSHSLTHVNLTRLPVDALRHELLESKQVLEGILGASVEALSVPFGECDDDVLRTALEVGYRSVVTCEPRVALGNETGEIGRFSVTPDDSMLEFRLKAAGAYGWLHRARRLRRVFVAALHNSRDARKAGYEPKGRGRTSHRSILGSAVTIGEPNRWIASSSEAS